MRPAHSLARSLARPSRPDEAASETTSRKRSRLGQRDEQKGAKCLIGEISKKLKMLATPGADEGAARTCCALRRGPASER